MTTATLRRWEWAIWTAVMFAGLLAFASALTVGAYLSAIAAGIGAGGALCMVIVRA